MAIEERSLVAKGAALDDHHGRWGDGTGRLGEEDRLNPHPLHEERRQECGTRKGDGNCKKTKGRGKVNGAENRGIFCAGLFRETWHEFEIRFWAEHTAGDFEDGIGVGGRGGLGRVGGGTRWRGGRTVAGRIVARIAAGGAAARSTVGAADAAGSGSG